MTSSALTNEVQAKYLKSARSTLDGHNFEVTEDFLNLGTSIGINTNVSLEIQIRIRLATATAQAFPDF